MNLHQDNGCLAAVPGQYVAEASHALPAAETATAEEAEASIDAGRFGPVRMIFYVRQRMKRRQSSHWAWVAYRAEKIAMVADPGGIASVAAASSAC